MEIKITKKMEKAMEDRIITSLKEGYAFGLADKVKIAIDRKLEENNFIDNLADKVAERIMLTEDELVDDLSGGVVKEKLLKIVETIMSETLTKIEEKVKSYGFIKIADRY